MDAPPGIPRRGNESHTKNSSPQIDGAPGSLKVRVLLWAIAVLVPLSCFFGVRLTMVQVGNHLAQTRAELDELLLADAQSLARKQGIRWDEERELAYAAAIAAYNNLPVGMFWQFRRWENGSKMYAWGQIVRDGSVRSLFLPSQQQVAQAGRTIRQSWDWFMYANRKKIQASLKSRGIKGPANMERVLGDRDLRAQFVTYVVEKIWRARANRKNQIRFILDAWEKWDKERGGL